MLFHILIRIQSECGKKRPYSELFRILIRIQSECGKIRTRITPNTNTFYAAKCFILIILIFSQLSWCMCPKIFKTQLPSFWSSYATAYENNFYWRLFNSTGRFMDWKLQTGLVIAVQKCPYLYNKAISAFHNKNEKKMGSDRKGSWFWNKWNCKKSFHQSSNKVCETKEDLKKLRKVWRKCGKSNESRKDMWERHLLVCLGNFVNERNIKCNYNIKSHCLPDIQQRFAYHLLHLFNVAYPLYQKTLCWSTSTLRLY